MIVGIDLGTTNSLVACHKDGETVVIPNRLGRLLTPSVVSVDENRQILIGETAREYGYMHPDSTARVFKRTMGTDHKYVLNGMEFSSEELSSFVLRSLKEDAEVYLGEEVDEAIISVPAYFNDNQRKATHKAGELAGLKVSRIISEPTASSIAYGVGADDRNERCLVLDLGGGTFDVSALEYFHNIIEVHAIAGDNMLGGEDFTMELMKLFCAKVGIPFVFADTMVLNALYKMCEKAKCEISEKKQVELSLNVNGIILEETITLEEYEEACGELLDRFGKPIEKCLRDGKYVLDDIDRVILVGGATRLSIVRDHVRKILNIWPQFYVDPDTSVAVGAALQAAMKQRDKTVEEVILTDVCPFTLGTEVVDDSGWIEVRGIYLPIIERNTTIPVSKTVPVYNVYENQKAVHVKVLQGESRMTSGNLLLGSIDVDIPPGPKGSQQVDITYTYDINSLLEVVVKVVSTGEVKKAIIQNEHKDFDMKEAEERFEKLSYLKQNPREDEENLFAILRGNRLYEECTGKDREQVKEALTSFDGMLAKGSRIEIERARRKLLDLFDEIENKDEVSFYS
ncbi:MAG: Hsp70 family protein [Erysipelotrichaceae bacterium]|nr:Hsp70 family protein [Erysipelotrichaceae bacterium]